MRVAKRPGNDYFEFGQEMGEITKMVLDKYRQKNLSHFTWAQVGEKLGIDASSALRRFQPTEKETGRGGYALSLADFFELCKLVEVHPVEAMADAHLEYEIKKRNS